MIWLKPAQTVLGLLGFVGGMILAEGSATAAGFPPPFYSAKEIRATVVDEDTGRPLEGVVVVAQWVLRRMYGDGPRLQVTEAVTDAQGRFFLPGWGPKPRPPFMELQAKSPEFLIFKHGYMPLGLRNESKEKFATAFPNYRTMSTRAIVDNMSFEGMPDQAVQESFWDGMTIQLEPYRGTPEKWVDLLESYADSIADEDAKHTRRFFEAIRAERNYLDLYKLDRTKRDAFQSLLGRIERLLR